MPALPSFMNKPGWKAKAANINIRSPFHMLRGDPSSTTPSTTAGPSSKEPEVLDIKDRGSVSESLDFDGGRPTSGFADLFDYKQQQPTESPQVKLELDVSPEALSDWFEANFLHAEAVASASIAESSTSSAKDPNSAGVEEATRQKVGQREGEEHVEDYTPMSEDVLASLRAMDASQFGSSDPSESNPERRRSRALPKPLAIPSAPADMPSPTGGRSRPFSIFDTPASSAVSGTTLARALLSNTFSLSSDNRSSRYRSGAMGLTRSDSATLPRGDFPFFSDRFSVGPDAPPLPENAEALYKAPSRNREEPKRSPSLKRHDSASSIGAPRRLPATPSSSSPRPASQDFDNEDELLVPPRPMFVDTNTTSRVSPASPRPPLPFPPGARPPPSRSPLIQQSKRDSFPVPHEDGVRELNTSHDRSPSAASDIVSPVSSIEAPQPSDTPGRLDDVLDYYQNDRTETTTPEPVIGGTFRPAISPISEEQSGSLSPPAPYRDKRESRTQPLGARKLSTGSPRSMLRSDSAPAPRRPAGARLSTRQLSLRPIGERPQSIQSIIEPPSPTGTNGSGSVYSVDSEQPESIDHHTIMKRFSRDRASSIPPIKVLRDTQIPDTYDLVTPNALSATPTAKDGVFDAQQFPETPNEFSPALSQAGTTNFAPPADRFEIDPTPSTPTAPLQVKSNQAASLAQQVLLHRTASANSSPVVPNYTPSHNAESPPSNRSSLSQRSLQQLPQPLGSPLSATFNPGETPHHDKRVSSNSLEPPPSIVNVSRSSSRGGQLSDAASMYTSSSHASHVKNLPIIPISPLFSQTHHHSLSTSSGRSMSSDHSLTPAVSSPDYSSLSQSQFSQHSHRRSPSSSTPSPADSPQMRSAVPRSRLPAAITINNRYSGPEELRPVPVNGHDAYDSPLTSAGPAESGNSPMPDSPTVSEVSEDQPEPEPALTYKNDVYGGRPSDIFRGTSLGSPPPYYTVVSDAIMRDTHAQTPRTGNSTGVPPSSSTTNLGITASVSEGSAPGVNQLTRESSMLGLRASRARPPLPAGPRRPSQQQLLNPSLSVSNGQGGRERTGSISSVNSHQPAPAPARQSGQSQASSSRPSKPSPTFTPRFQVPPPKWRGYTMEAAKWTFTSAQLQEIVSRAIRQSAEASSIRLLRQDVLDNEIPTEIRRLESQRTDLKTRYKVLAKRRTTLFDTLALQLSNSSDDPSLTSRLVEDLREMATTLDRLAEELHSLDEQLSYLYSLMQIHNGSALAMALRKLNASFLNQTHENQALRNQISTLEAERDEAWQQAEDVAREFDSISSPSSQRSSRVLAQRKSSIRVSRAGLRSGNRYSQRSSVGSNAYLGTPLSARSPGMRPPPVPPIPTMPRSAAVPIVKPRPLNLNTTDPVIRQPQVMSAGVITPTSESRIAQVETEIQIYNMLGMAPPHTGLRRSLSATAIRPESTPAGSALPGLLAGLHSPDVPSSGGLSAGRRASLPPDSALAETYNIMAADRHAVLATIDMLSSTDP